MSTRPIRKYAATVTVNVNVDMDEFDTEDLADELRRRGRLVSSEGDDFDPLAKMRDAYKRGDEAQFLQLAREYVAEQKGVIL